MSQIVRAAPNSAQTRIEVAVNESQSFAGQDVAEVLIFRNPKAGARSRDELIAELVRQLEAKSWRVRVVGDVDTLVESVNNLMAAGRLRAVIAAGGDGTVGLVVNKTPIGTPITVLPLGTENLLSKYLGIEANVDQLVQLVDENQIVTLDVGEANGRLFLLMLGCGFDADVVKRLHDSRTGHIHHLSYAKPIIDSLCSYDYPELRLYCDAANETPQDDPCVAHENQSSNEPATGVSRQADIISKWAFVVNLPRYAGGLSFVPNARGNDGRLDVCTFKQGSLWNGLWYLGCVASGMHETMTDCTIRQVKNLRIEANGNVPYQLDGDPGGTLPVDVRVLPNRLTLIVPRTFLRDSQSK